MKKVALIFVFIIAHLSATAQIEKGTSQVGIGGLPIIYPNSSEDIGYSLRINYGYFIFNNLSIGVVPFAGKVGDINSIGINGYLRYYLLNKGIALFIEGGGGFGRLNYESTPQFNGTMSSINVGPGIHYRFKNNLSVEFLLQYARLRNINFPEETTTGNTIIPALGIQYFIIQ